MIVSHRHRFIFIKTQKTAGTSIEVFLSSHCGPDDIITPIEPPVPPHRAQNTGNGRFYNHIPARKVRSLLPSRVWEEYFTFCVERNPWDKTLSHFYMWDALKGPLDFDRYLRRRKGLPLNYPLYTHRGRVIVDRVLRYENLDQELGEVMQRLGIPFGGSLDVRAKSEFRSDRRPYREVLTAEQRHVIDKVFAREIALHGYRY